MEDFVLKAQSGQIFIIPQSDRAKKRNPNMLVCHDPKHAAQGISSLEAEGFTVAGKEILAGL